MPKHKVIQLSEFNFALHSWVLDLCEQDKIKLRQDQAVELLNAQQAKLCLEQMILPVVIDPEDSKRYLLLQPKPQFFWLSQHPALRNVRVHLNVYNHDECDALLQMLNLIQPAINHFFTPSTLENISCRLALYKLSNPKSRITKRYLAKLAQVLPSAIRSSSAKENCRG